MPEHDYLKDLLHRDTSRNFLKDAFKEAAREWLQELWDAGASCLGKKIIKLAYGSAIVGLLYLILWQKGKI